MEANQPDQPNAQPLPFVQGDDYVAAQEAKREQARRSVDAILAHIQQEHDALAGVSPQARADLMFVHAKLTHTKTNL